MSGLDDTHLRVGVRNGTLMFHRHDVALDSKRIEPMSFLIGGGAATSLFNCLQAS
jgi:hypothetical protein